MKVFKLEEHLVVAPPSFLDVTYQLLPEHSEDTPVICSWKNYSLRFFIETKSMKGNQNHELFWANKETELKLISPEKKVRILKAGNYQTHVNREVSFRIYQYLKGDEVLTKMLHLISSKHRAYLLMVHVFDVADFASINENVMELIKTARITAPQRQPLESV